LKFAQILKKIQRFRVENMDRAERLNNTRSIVLQRSNHYVELLAQGLKASFTGLEGFQAWVAETMRQLDLQIDQFTVSLDELKEQPGNQVTYRTAPSTLQRGTNVVGRLPGKGANHGILVFGHADKRPDTFEWAKDQPELIEKEGRFYGPGIADDVSGLVAALAAVDTCRQLGVSPQGDVLIASILGKQLGVFGTYGLVRRYGPLDAAVYVHPAESGGGLGELKMASLGTLEFLIEVEGKGPESKDSVKTIFSRYAFNAIDKGMYLCQGLQAWATEMSKQPQYRNDRLEALAGTSLAVSFGKFKSGMGNEVYEIPTHATIRGNVSFAPNIRLETVQKEFLSAFQRLAANDPWLAQDHARLTWGDMIDESCQADENSVFLNHAAQIVGQIKGKMPRFYYGHSISDIRYPLLYWKAQAFGIGPLAGDLARPSEWVDRKEFLETIMILTELIVDSA
jgi:acetylornithine deacetylase